MDSTQQSLYVYKNFEKILEGLEKGHRVDYTDQTGRIRDGGLSFSAVDTKNGKKNIEQDALAKIKTYLEANAHLLEMKDSPVSQTFKAKLEEAIEKRTSDLESRKNRWFVRKAHVDIMDQRISELNAIKAIQFRAPSVSASVQSSPLQSQQAAHTPTRKQKSKTVHGSSAAPSAAPSTPSHRQPVAAPSAPSTPQPSTSGSSTLFDSPMLPPPPGIGAPPPPPPPPGTPGASTPKKEILFKKQKPHSEIMQVLTSEYIRNNRSKVEGYINKLNGIVAAHDQRKRLNEELQTNEAFLRKRTAALNEAKKQLSILKQALEQNRSITISYQVGKEGAKEDYSLMLLIADDIAILKKKDSKTQWEALSLDYQISKLKEMIREASHEVSETEGKNQPIRADLEKIEQEEPLFKSLSSEELEKAIKSLSENIRRYNLKVKEATSPSTSPKLSRTRSQAALNSPSISSATTSEATPLDRLVKTVKEGGINLASVIKVGSSAITEKMVILD